MSAAGPGSHDFHLLGTETLVDAPIIAVRRDRVLMPGGGAADREVVEHFGAAAIAAVDADGRIALVRQYRRCVDRRLWELPAGILDVLGEDPLRAARRELREEAGVSARSWRLITDVITSPGFCDEACRIYLARELEHPGRPAAGEDEEADLELRWTPMPEAVDMVLRGEVANSIAVVGIMLAREALRDPAASRPADSAFPLRPTALPARREAAGARPGDDLKRVPGRPG